jgi:N utilization substance protein B
MISRRLIRIKIVQVLYAYFSDNNSSLEKSDKELAQSIKKAYDLYNLFALLLINMVDYANERIEIARNKNIPTHEDLNPNTRFVDNKVIMQLRNSKAMSEYISKNKLSWNEYSDIVKKMYLKVTGSEYFDKYMNGPYNGFEDDRKLVITILENEIEEWEFLYNFLEEESIYWNDDIEFVVSMLIKTVERLKENYQGAPILPMYKNDDDREFGRTLLRKTILKNQQYREIIDKYTRNWDIERIAQIDILVMVVALSELIEFPSIPVKVTLNEYIDIAKFYSTDKSNEFVNGILDKILIDLRKDNKIVKTGRGLMGDNDQATATPGLAD